MTDNLKELYESIIRDEYVINSLDEINKKINYVIDHGKLHVQNLEKYVDEICRVFNLPDRTKYLAKIAVVFHDFGRLVSRENHSSFSLQYAKEYLQDKIDREALELILDAIYRHERECFDFNSTNDLAWVVIMADKLDYTRDRYIQSLMQEKYKTVYSYRIKSFELMCNDGTLLIRANAYDVEDEMVEKFEKNFKLFQKVAKHFGIEKTEMSFVDINTNRFTVLKG